MKEHFFRYSGGTYIQGDFYFSNLEYNALFVLKKDMEYPSFIAHFPNEPINIFMLHKSCIKYENKLIFIPKAGQYFHIYNLDTGAITELRIERKRWDIEPVSESVWIGNMLYVFPTTFDEPIYIIDPLLEELVENWSVSDWCRNNITTNELLKMCRVSFNADNIYIPVYNSNKLLVVNKNNLKCDLKVLRELKLFGAFRTCRGVLLSTNNDDSLYEFSEDGEISIIKEPQRKLDGRAYNHVIDDGERIVLIYRESTEIEIIYRNKDEIIKLKPDVHVIDENTPYFFGYTQLDKDFILHPFNTKEMVKISVDDLETEKMFSIRDIYDYSVEPYRSLFAKESVNVENSIWGLDDFLDYVIS